MEKGYEKMVCVHVYECWFDYVANDTSTSKSGVGTHDMKDVRFALALQQCLQRVGIARFDGR